MPDIGTGIGMRVNSADKVGISWSSYWATRTPSALVLTALSPTSIRASWTNAGTGFDGHSVEISTDAVAFTEVDTVLFGTNTLDITGLTSGTLYYVRVRAYKGLEYSPYCAVVSGETIYMPNEVAGLAAWYDVSQITGKNDNDSLTSITDFSGNDLHLNTSGTSTYKTNILNGHPCARYNGTSDYNRLVGTALYPAIKTIFIVANKLSGGNEPIIRFYSRPEISIAGTELRIRATNNVDTSGANIANGTPFILSAYDAGANSKIYCNGGHEGTGTLAASSNDRLYWGWDTTNYANEDIFENIIYTGVLDNANRRRVEIYLSWKYGITLEPILVESVFVHTEASVVYVSPTGTGDGSTEETATDLQNALTSENVIAGDTIMMLDGTYTGNYSSTITGTANAKIYIKPKNYMAAIIDGSLQIGDLGGINGAYTRIRNIRFTNSDTNRGTWETPEGTISRQPNIFPAAPNVEIINVMYDNGGVGVLSYEASDGLLLYGAIAFNNGWADDTLSGAQNLYIHSLNKTVKHCIFGGAFKKSVAVYTTNWKIENINLEENVVFSRDTLLFGGNHGETVSGSLLRNHVLNNGIQLGYVYTPNDSVTCNNNRVYGNNPLTASYFQNLTIDGNKFVGQESSGNGCFEINYTTEKVAYAINNNEYHNVGEGTPVFHEGAFNGDFAGWQALGHDADGSYSTELPTTNEIFVYPNEYPDADDMRMGIVVIWNWEGDETVEVDLTDLGLEVGTTYRWRQAQDPLVDIDTWECAGNSYTFAMTGHTVAKPIGFDEELIPTQFPTFGCFIIEKVV